MGRDTPCSSQKLGTGAIRRHLPGGLSFLTPDASCLWTRLSCPWLSRAFLQEICPCQHRNHRSPGCRRQGEATGEPGPDEVKGKGSPHSPASMEGPQNSDPQSLGHRTGLGPAEQDDLARCDFRVRCSKPSSPPSHHNPYFLATITSALPFEVPMGSWQWSGKKKKPCGK